MTNDPGRSTGEPWQVGPFKWEEIALPRRTMAVTKEPANLNLFISDVLTAQKLADYLNSLEAKLREAEAALIAIEGITGDDPSELWSMEAAAKRLRGRAKEMQVKLSQVYRAAHASLRDHPCYGVHEAWREEVNARKEAGSA